jgi:hypothetical protein
MPERLKRADLPCFYYIDFVMVLSRVILSVSHKELPNMERKRAPFIENEPRMWACAKIAIFVVTIMAPWLLFSLSMGRFVPQLFVFFPLGLFTFVTL